MAGRARRLVDEIVPQDGAIGYVGIEIEIAEPIDLVFPSSHTEVTVPLGHSVASGERDYHPHPGRTRLVQDLLGVEGADYSERPGVRRLELILVEVEIAEGDTRRWCPGSELDRSGRSRHWQGLGLRGFLYVAGQGGEQENRTRRRSESR
jgi:hypothetical protein